jgi:hypothetical protein
MGGFFCDREGIRTPDRLLRRQMLYPAELRDLDIVCLDSIGIRIKQKSQNSFHNSYLKF